MANEQGPESQKNNADIKMKDVESYVMTTPYIIVIGISKYPEPNEPLKAIAKDMEHMKDLWMNQFKFDPKYISIISEESDSEYVTKNQINKALNKIRNKLDDDDGDYKECDGLMFIYSGHGMTDEYGINHIICGDGGKLSMEEIKNKFSANNCDSLSGKPKIMYMDCCRGGTEINAIDISLSNQQSKGNKNNISNRYINVLSDFYIHYATSQDYVSWGKSEEHGSHFIYSLYNCYKNYFEAHKINGITLHETSIKINEMVNKSNNGQQTSEILDRLTYNVYIKPNFMKKNKENFEVLSRRELVTFHRFALNQKEHYDQKILQLENTIAILKKQLKSNNLQKEEVETKELEDRSNTINFTGIYKFVSSNNFDAYLKDSGYGYVARKIALAIKATVQISHQDDTLHYTMPNTTAFHEDVVHGNQTHPWQIGKEYFITGGTGDKIKKSVSWDNEKKKLIAISTNVVKNETVSYHVYFDEKKRFCLKRISKNGVVASFVFKQRVQ